MITQNLANSATIRSGLIYNSAGFIGLVNGEFGSGLSISVSPAGVVLLAGDCDPTLTETHDLGSASAEWDNLFVQNSPTVSDVRTKNDLGSADPIIEVMRNLDARIWSRKIKVIKEAVPSSKGERQKVEMIKEESIEVIDGIPTIVKREVEKPVFKSVQVVNDKGPVFTTKGDVITPLMYDVPVMEDYDIPEEAEILSSHSRPHTGFMAQSVKQAMTDAGIEDWAGYAYHEEEDIHALRLLEFIAPILAYTQELEQRIKALED